MPRYLVLYAAFFLISIVNRIFCFSMATKVKDLEAVNERNRRFSFFNPIEDHKQSKCYNS